MHWSKGPDAERIKQTLRDSHWAHDPVKRVLVLPKIKVPQELIHTKTSRDKRAEAMRGRKHTEETKQKMRKPKDAAAVANMTNNHYSQKIGSQAYKKKFKDRVTPEFRAKTAECVRQGLSGYKTAIRGQYTCRKGRNFIMRSSWERRLAEWLDNRGYDWEYEPRVLRLPSGGAYLPDFQLIDGRYLEVKGYALGVEKVTEARTIGLRVLLLNYRALKLLGVL